MKTKIVSLAILLCGCCSVAFSQKSRPHTPPKARPTAQKTVNEPVAPVSTTSYSYYDAGRGGYVFVNNGKETFTPTSPRLPANTVVTRTTLPVSRWLDLDLYPQQHYPNTINLNAPGERTINTTPLPRN